jgi:hypothetical protein
MCLIIMYAYYAHFDAKLSLNIGMKKHILHNTCIKTIIYAYYNKVPSFYIKRNK